MITTQVILGVLLGLVSIALIALVLAQPGKDKRLSGAIAGGSETYFGKGKTAVREKLLNKLTVIGCVVMLILVVVLFCLGEASSL